MGILLKDTQNVIPDVPEVTDLSWIIRSLVKKKKKKRWIKVKVREKGENGLFRFVRF